MSLPEIHTIPIENQNMSYWHTMENLRENFAILNEIFRTQENAYINIELLSHSNEKFGKKVFKTVLNRASITRGKPVKRVYVQGNVENWYFSPRPEYFPDISKFKLEYAGKLCVMKSSEYDLLSFEITILFLKNLKKTKLGH